MTPEQVFILLQIDKYTFSWARNDTLSVIIISEKFYYKHPFGAYKLIQHNVEFNVLNLIFKRNNIVIVP